MKNNTFRILVSITILLFTNLIWADFKNSIYKNKKYNYEITLPQDWIMGEAPDENSALFLDPFEHRRDDFKENLIISVSPLYKIKNLDELYLKSLLYMRKHYKGFNIIKEKKSNINGVDGQMIIYQYSSLSNIKYKVMQMFFVQGENTYSLTFTALSKTFSQYKYPMAECFFSFRIK